jgi:hypothetical protein
MMTAMSTTLDPEQLRREADVADGVTTPPARTLDTFYALFRVVTSYLKGGL